MVTWSGGTEGDAFCVDDNLRVGIGTTTPSVKVEIFGNNSARNTLQNILAINGGTSSNNVYSGFGMGLVFNGRDYSNEPRDYAYIYGVQEASSTSTPGGDPGFTSQLTFYTNSGGAVNTLPTQKMVINALGNVGIGTTNPLDPGATGVNRTLQLTGATYSQFITSVTGGLANNKIWRNVVRSSDAGNSYQIQTLNDFAGGEVTALEITRSGTSISKVTFPNGNVGIGTSSPGEKLVIRETSNTATTRIKIEGGSYGFTLGKTTQAANYVHLKPSSNSPAVFRIMPNVGPNYSYMELWGTDFE